MAAWQYGFDEIPQDILGWITALDNGMFTVVSPNTGHSTVFDWDWYIIQTEVGCLYAVPPESFEKKYCWGTIGGTLEQKTGRL